MLHDILLVVVGLLIGAVIGLLIVGFFCLLTKKGGIEWREFG